MAPAITARSRFGHAAAAAGRARATRSRSAPPTAIRTAPTVTGAASGPSAWAVPVVPKHTALRRTRRRAMTGAELFHNSPRYATPTFAGASAPPYSAPMAQIAVVGPGAVGAPFAAAAERAGHAVSLHGRRAAPAPVVELPGGEEHALAGPVAAVPGDASPTRWVLLAVKTHQTAGVADWLAALTGPESVVVVLQNGVEHRALVEPLAGPATVLPGIVWCPSEGVAPGRVRQRGPARLSVPDEPAGTALAALFGDAAQID